jgi:hypothetical protein
MENAIREAVNLLGDAAGMKLVKENPQRAVQGEQIKAGEIKESPSSRRGLFDFLKKASDRP